MPKLPLPPEADQLLRRPNPAVIATVRPDGSPHTAATWYDWDGSRVLVNMDVSRLRLRNMRENPHVCITVLASDSWYRQLTVYGRVAELRDDTDLADIDKLSLRYTRELFRNRQAQRVSAFVELDGWYGWEGSTHWPVESV